MLEKSELEPETSKEAREIELEEEQRRHTEVAIQKEREGVILRVYQRRAIMTRETIAVVE